MDKRLLADLFRNRLSSLLQANKTSTAEFLREAQIDRSALSQFLNPDCDRLPRTEMLRRIATVSGVSVDWLLGLENAPEGRQDYSPSLQVEVSKLENGMTPLQSWHVEAEGQKLRYVPSALPDMMQLSWQNDGSRSETLRRKENADNILVPSSLRDMDLEIAMPLQTLQDVSEKTGCWRMVDLQTRRAQLELMAQICEENYPAVRLHLFDGSEIFSAPFTVFGRRRAAIYVGDAYFVLTAPDQVRSFSMKFDGLVRNTTTSPDRVHETLTLLARKASG